MGNGQGQGMRGNRVKFIISKYELARLQQLSAGVYDDVYDDVYVPVNMFESMDKIKAILGGIDESMAVEIEVDVTTNRSVKQ